MILIIFGFLCCNFSDIHVLFIFPTTTTVFQLLCTLLNFPFFALDICKCFFEISLLCLSFLRYLCPFWNFSFYVAVFQISVSFLKFPLEETLLRNCVNRKGNTIAGNHAFHPIPHSSSPKTKAKIKTNTKTRKKTIDKVTKKIMLSSDSLSPSPRTKTRASIIWWEKLE